MQDDNSVEWVYDREWVFDKDLDGWVGRVPDYKQINRKTSAIIDAKTANSKLLRTAQLYKKMGIKNCALPLLLLSAGMPAASAFGHRVDINVSRDLYQDTFNNDNRFDDVNFNLAVAPEPLRVTMPESDNFAKKFRRKNSGRFMIDSFTYYTDFMGQAMQWAIIQEVSKISDKITYIESIVKSSRVRRLYPRNWEKFGLINAWYR